MGFLEAWKSKRAAKRISTDEFMIISAIEIVAGGVQDWVSIIDLREWLNQNGSADLMIAPNIEKPHKLGMMVVGDKQLGDGDMHIKLTDKGRKVCDVWVDVMIPDIPS